TMWTKSNHSDAAAVRWPREALRQVKCPTVVIHAAKDQLIPLKHSEALRDDVPGATLVVIEDCGHELPSRVRSLLADTILANTRKGEEAATARG
ncbi:alpha/beta hydrolase, partial [Candidatus Bathyarchaeota archaeon]|nr:alpha/beta hydrolase [Candidatus Bathyarchaeota archaeon]